MTTKTITLVKAEKEPKHSVRYNANEPNPIVSSIYLSRLALPLPVPTKVKLTIEWEE